MTWEIIKADSKVTLAETHTTIKRGDIYDVKVTENVSRMGLIVSVSDPDVASVVFTGGNVRVIARKKTGTVQVTVTAPETANYNTATVTFTVTVK